MYYIVTTCGEEIIFADPHKAFAFAKQSGGKLHTVSR